MPEISKIQGGREPGARKSSSTSIAGGVKKRAHESGAPGRIPPRKKERNQGKQVWGAGSQKWT